MKSARQKPLATKDATPGKLILPKNQTSTFPFLLTTFLWLNQVL